MNRAIKIKLIAESFQPDAIGQNIPTETNTEVFAITKDVSRDEFNNPVDGLRPSKVFRVLVTEYHDEEIIEYNNTRYTIYRTYLRNDARIELYAGERIG